MHGEAVPEEICQHGEDGMSRRNSERLHLIVPLDARASWICPTKSSKGEGSRCCDWWLVGSLRWKIGPADALASIVKYYKLQLFPDSENLIEAVMG